VGAYSTRKANQVKVYSFNTKSETWWEQNKTKIAQLDAEVIRFEASAIASLAQMINRTMDWSVTITGQSAFVATENGEVEVGWQVLSD